jgi:serine/threonine protein kinase
MALAVGTKLLNGHYELIGSRISESGQGELWGARDTTEYVKPYMVKAWPFYSEKPPDVQRALWDSELRTLYRVRSTPGSEQSLLQLHNVGIDHQVRHFVMVFKTEGLDALSSVLSKDRSAFTWLSGQPRARRELWQMLGNIADGLDLLHEQQVVHRCVSPDSVFLEPGEGPESCRLGGFEWSVRLGQPAVGQASRKGWETPPEQLIGSGFGPDGDWYAFGILVARCLLPIEHLDQGNKIQSAGTHKERYRQTHIHLDKARGRLLPIESDLIRGLINEDPALRYRHHSEIAAHIKEIIRELQQTTPGDGAASRHLVIIDPRDHRLVDACLERGLREELDLQPGDAFDPKVPAHVTRLIGFLYRDFREGGLLTPVPNRDLYCLSGQSTHLRIGPARSFITNEQSWQNARCTGAFDYVTNAADGQVKIPGDRLKFFPTTNMRELGNELSSSASWEAVLPRIDRAQPRRAEQERFSQFVRITNQIDILIRDAELFRCRVTDVSEQDGICTGVKVVEIPRQHPPLQKFRAAGGMADFLLREKSSGKPESRYIQLYPADSESIAVRLSDQADWQVEDVDITGHSATLVPVGAEVPPPARGEERVLRTKGLRGQVLLIKRRKEAIDRLSSHNYLLESVTTPGAVLMDSTPGEDLLTSGGDDLPFPLSIDTVDKSKLGQITKILGVRPIYALQGPPGTGKTHLVAWLLREILAEDPVAQILITAQAHPAVDVLRAKVEEEAFRAVPADQRPLAIRLRRSISERPDGLTHDDPGSERQVTRELLVNTIARLAARAEELPLNGVQDEWHAACRLMLKELNTSDVTVTKEFRELVKRSASITYSTTGDGDLAALADEVSYDWSIVEEAGKAHGFELALPMYLGHRWLLIGDPKQLPPYRIEDYQKAVSEMDATVDALDALGGDTSMLDRDFLNQWRQRSDEERSEFKKYCQAWLKVFEQLHRLCSFHQHEDGLLRGQHRMHPDIGDLISEAYYDSRLEHYTKEPETGAPKAGILHGLSVPPEIAGKAVVWLDIPAAEADPRCAERHEPTYRNFAEAQALDNFLRSLRNSDAGHQLKLAILSPYAQQVGCLRDHLDSAEFRHQLHSEGIRLAPDPRRPIGERGENGFFTVDSFQGNQAEIIAVSLVRNNTQVAGKGLGFLIEGSRMNVLLSRAERLLVLVGSWQFFRNQVSHVSRDEKIDDPLRHLAVVMDRLEKWFAEGKAIRLPADLTGLRDDPHLTRRVAGVR